MIAAGDLLGDEPLLTDGLRMLGWLCRTQDNEGHLSTVPVGGWRPDVPRHRFDQQPIEAAAMADACATAAAVTGDDALGGAAVPGDRLVPGRKRHLNGDVRPPNGRRS